MNIRRETLVIEEDVLDQTFGPPLLVNREDSILDPPEAPSPPTIADDPARRDAGRDDTPAPVAGSDNPTLSLTDFLDVATLQEVQDRFAAVTRLRTSIHDAEGRELTVPTDPNHESASDQVLGQLVDDGRTTSFTAPIVIEGQQLGSIVIEDQPVPPPPVAEARDRLREVAGQLQIPPAEVDRLLAAADDATSPSRAAGLRFLYLLANSIARLCYQEYQSRRRADELSVLHKLSTALSTTRDVQHVLDTAARSIAQELQVKAASIRLLDTADNNELVARAVYNLSETYLNKAAIRLDRSRLFQQVRDGQVAYVEDMTTDDRIIYPDDARREGLVSLLCAPVRYQQRFIGVLQLYSAARRRFTGFETRLVVSMAQLLGGAIETARLESYRREARQVRRQLHLAADVQQRMLPGVMPDIPPFEIAARYVPSMELAGDFYDMLELQGHLGVAIGDVVGKGVPASLLMASVRASLRAYAQDLYDLDQVVARVNVALTRDTLDNEFATIWYGVLDPKTRRLTYCSAGHEPALLVRHGRVHALGAGGMAVGVDAAQHYDKGIYDLEPGDVLLLYTDGLVDAFDFNEEKFGRARAIEALQEAIDDGRSPADIINHMLWCQRNFTGLHRATDDTTLVVVRVAE